MDVEIARIQLLDTQLRQEAPGPEAVARVHELSGIADRDISSPATQVSAETEAKFIRYACDVLGDITFAARSGLQFTSTTTLAGYISKYSRDLRQVMENTTRFHRFIDPTLSFNLHVSGNSASLEASWKDAHFSRYHRRTEFLMFAVVSRIRALTRRRFNPIELRLQHQAGHREGDFSRAAGFPVIFGAEKLEIILPLSALDMPVPTYDPRLREHLLDYGERLMAESNEFRQTLRARVEGLITRSLPGTVIGAEDAARNLGMSARTFARRLNEEGTSYREIVDDLRCDLAQTFLKNDMALAEIAYSLGYADQAAFSTAFKRWTGQAPSAFRIRVERPVRT
ncbi:AraC family transcriptional regulator [Ruegeria marisrubri]|uniref:AraC family transcriptional regulator n=1 Tax=Ruegeria marisrubri TaxID=1685379 RepID=A0A0X3TY31_9RHOB|nr:AraC family transcriptional regulator [Ruegeria marisrubri]KUJ80574.1 AraC family transcriptional regulator [Ruegeria marisrubri]